MRAELAHLGVSMVGQRATISLMPVARLDSGVSIVGGWPQRLYQWRLLRWLLLVSDRVRA